MNQRVWLRATVLAAGLFLAKTTDVRADDATDSYDASVRLLRSAIQVSRDGRHNMFLRALRQMRDAQLEPLFSELFQSDHPSLKIHGLLGLAECKPAHELDLVRLAGIDSAPLQAEIVSAALDNELLGAESCKKLLGWQGLDAGVKIIVAAELVKARQLAPGQPGWDVVKENLKADNIARRGLASLLLAQAGEASGLAELQAIDKSQDPKREATREMLLQTALRYELDKVGVWASGVAAEQGINPRLSLLGLRTAMRFGAPGATDRWRQRYNSDPDIARRTQLALVAIQVSPWLEPAVFEPLTRSDDSMVKQIGITGAAIAGKKDIAATATALVQMDHPIVNDWALGYCRKTASPTDALAIMATVVTTADAGPERSKPQRWEDAVQAVQVILDRDPERGVDVLKKILRDDKQPAIVRRLVLVGLMRAQPALAAKAIEGATRFEDNETSDLLVVLRAKTQTTITPEDMRSLSLVVRGAGSPLPTVRLQAAWIYLKHSNKTQPALAEAMGKAG